MCTQAGSHSTSDGDTAHLMWTQAGSHSTSDGDTAHLMGTLHI